MGDGHYRRVEWYWPRHGSPGSQTGARVVLAARNEEALHQLAEEINGNECIGGVAVAVEADVSDETAMRHVADKAIERFGRIDTWVNCAGVYIFGRLLDVSLEDQRRLVETNFWGVVNGSRIAFEHFRRNGGALINIDSALSDRAIPLKGT